MNKLARAAVAGGLTTLLLGSAALPASAQTWESNPDGTKAYVCKAVSKPGSPREHQWVVISVDRKDWMKIGSSFQDAQLGSFVVGFGMPGDKIKPVGSDCMIDVDEPEPTVEPSTPAPEPTTPTEQPSTPAEPTEAPSTPAEPTEQPSTPAQPTPEPTRGVEAITGVEDEVLPVAPLAMLGIASVAFGSALTLKRRR